MSYHRHLPHNGLAATRPRASLNTPDQSTRFQYAVTVGHFRYGAVSVIIVLVQDRKGIAKRNVTSADTLLDDCIRLTVYLYHFPFGEDTAICIAVSTPSGGGCSSTAHRFCYSAMKHGIMIHVNITSRWSLHISFCVRIGPQSAAVCLQLYAPGDAQTMMLISQGI